MSVISKIWVQAHLRRCFAAGLTGAVLRHGADDAGTIYIRVYQGPDQYRLYGPPPGSSVDEQGDRLWDCPLGQDTLSAIDIAAYLERQLSYDPDIWIVEIDDPAGTACLQSS